MRRQISSGSPLEAEYGYARALVDGDWVFVSGLVDPRMKIEIEVTARKRQAE